MTQASSFAPGLAAPRGDDPSPIGLLFPLRAGEFWERYPALPCFEAAPAARLPCVGEASFDSAEGVIRQSPCPPLHTAFLSRAGASEQRPCDAAEAVELFRRGHTISLERGGASFAPMLQLGRSLAAELGAFRSPVPSISVSPKGAGTPVHFDGLEVLVVQLAGRKRWHISRNTAVASPDFPFFPSAQGPGARGGIVPDYLTELPSPTQCDQPATVVLEPGAALFLPRGFWHETQALDDSVSVTFKLPLPTRYAVALEALAQHLRRDPHWRAPFTGAERGEALGRRDQDNLHQLLARLGGELCEVEVRPRAGARLRRNRHVALSLSRLAPDEPMLRVVCGADAPEVGLELPEQVLPVLEWLERRGEVTELELLRAFPEARVAGLRRLVEWLIERGALQTSGELQMGQAVLRLGNETFS